MELEYCVKQQDLSILEDTIYKNYKSTKKNNFLSTYILIIIYSIIILAFTLFYFKIYSGFILNDTFDSLTHLLSRYNGFSFIIPLIAVTIILTFGALILPFLISALENTSYKKEFNTLINTFSIFIEENTLILDSKTIKFKVPLLKGNILIKNDVLFLFDTGKFLTIIPLSKVNNKEFLLSKINEYTEVVKYDL